ncbi:MAG: transcriptional regulator [Anaerolinea sp.]|nr:transcriptional regulator [Anaerolinea sp.]
MSKPKDPFAAIADVTRRTILELLRDEGPLPAGEIAARFPQITREAVSRHVRLLREAGLLTREHRGREVWYALDAEPLRALHTAWLLSFAPLWESSLAELKRAAEEDA